VLDLMVTTTLSYADSRYRASTGEGYNGVVRAGVNGFYGTGALLYDGLAVLTAAHLFAGTSGGTQLVADFDDRTYAHDALGRLIVKPGT
jgi:hypothetical protein